MFLSTPQGPLTRLRMASTFLGRALAGQGLAVDQIARRLLGRGGLLPTSLYQSGGGEAKGGILEGSKDDSSFRGA